MRARRLLIALSSLALVATGLTLASSASADSVQVQSYQRASMSEACGAQLGETPWEAAWGADSSWHPTWEQWANGGTGGWTCTRSIVWSQDSTAGGYNIGDPGPGGGTVFYDAGSQQSWGRYLEAAPTDVTAGTGMEWSGNMTGGLVGTSTDIGTGAANTQLMIGQGCLNPPSTNCGSESGKAATAAVAYSTPTAPVGQWFLPSQGELNAMCMWAFDNWSWPICNNNGPGYGTPVNGGFASANYWSSSQFSDSYAWYQSFVVGYSDFGYKNGAVSVRPVRAF
jgi:hypothetical protein